MRFPHAQFVARYARPLGVLPEPKPRPAAPIGGAIAAITAALGGGKDAAAADALDRLDRVLVALGLAAGGAGGAPPPPADAFDDAGEEDQQKHDAARVGKTKVFLRQSAFDAIEARRSRALAARATAVQAVVRGRVTYRRFAKLGCAVLRAQASLWARTVRASSRAPPPRSLRRSSRPAVVQRNDAHLRRAPPPD